MAVDSCDPLSAKKSDPLAVRREFRPPSTLCYQSGRDSARGWCNVDRRLRRLPGAEDDLAAVGREIGIGIVELASGDAGRLAGIEGLRPDGKPGRGAKPSELNATRFPLGEIAGAIVRPFPAVRREGVGKCSSTVTGLVVASASNSDRAEKPQAQSPTTTPISQGALPSGKISDWMG